MAKLLAGVSLTIECLAANYFAIVSRRLLLGFAARTANFSTNVIQTISFALTNRLAFKLNMLILAGSVDDDQTTAALL